MNIEETKELFQRERLALSNALDRITREEMEDADRQRKPVWAAIGVIGNVVSGLLDAHHLQLSSPPIEGTQDEPKMDEG